MSVDSVFNLFNQFLGIFPTEVQGLISIVLAIAIVVAIIKVLQRDFIYLILLVVLLPASIPVLKNVWDILVSVVMFLVGKR